jgi:predicted nucleotidyltransferase
MVTAPHRDGWSRRDEERRIGARRIVEHVEARLGAVRTICESHGVREAFVFGSVARAEPRPGSDLDIAVGGCPPESFFKLAAALERTLDMPLDLVDLDTAPADRSLAIRRDGRPLFTR